MNQADAQNMQSYPSPHAVAADGGGAPFYNDHSPQPHNSPQNTDQLRQLAQLQREIAPNMSSGGGGGGNGGGNGPDGNDHRGQTMVAHQHGLSHPNFEQHVQHVQRSPQMGLGQMGGQQHFETTGPDSKRSKISRACDECRRKKIRCDAEGDETTVMKACGSCRRLNLTCLFSRVPQKRGPSKGYIKELADRVQTLEGNLLPNPGDSTSATAAGRKRTRSVSGDLEVGFQPQRVQPAWPSQERQRTQNPPPMSFQSSARSILEVDGSLNGLQPQAQWRQPPLLHQQGNSFDNGREPASFEYTDIANWDDSVIESYHSTFQHLYPLLSYSPELLRQRVASCPALLQTAFYESLTAAVLSLPPPNVPSIIHPGHQNAGQLLAAVQLDLRNRSMSLVYLQTMILLAIEADNNAPTSAVDNSAKGSYSVLLASAIGAAYKLKLHQSKPPSFPGTDLASETSHLERRLWWTLIIMDRWHAASRSTPTLIPDGSVVVYPEDEDLLSVTTFHLARFSVVVGHISAVNLLPKDLPTFGLAFTPLYSTLIKGELDRTREAIPSDLINPPEPLLHLVHSYIQIQLHLMLPESDPHELLVFATQIVAELVRNPGRYSPLTQHITTLVVYTLMQLKDFEQTRGQAENNLKILLDNSIMPSSRDQFLKNKIIENLQSDAIDEKSREAADAARRGLEQLEQLAHVAATQDPQKSSVQQPAEVQSRRPHDLAELVHDGYFN